MAVEIVMPRFGWTMEEGLLAEWTKHDGDPIKVGDILFTVESDKALNEVESFETGILRIPPNAPQAGATVKVVALLAYAVQPGEAAPFEGQSMPVAQATEPAAAPPSAPANVTTSDAPAGPRKERHTVSPRARRIAGELGVDLAQLRGTGRTGRIVERDVRAASVPRPSRPEVRASPIARRAAAELGVDLEQLASAKPGMRLERADVEAAARMTAGAPPRSEPATPITGVRRVIAERMMAGVHTTAPVTLTTEVDATELVRLRGQLRTTRLPRPSPCQATPTSWPDWWRTLWGTTPPSTRAWRPTPSPNQP